MVGDANTIERAVTRHSMVHTGLLGRRCGFNPSRRHTAASSADSIDRVVGLGRVRIRWHLSASEGAPDPTYHDKPTANLMVLGRGEGLNQERAPW